MQEEANLQGDDLGGSGGRKRGFPGGGVLSGSPNPDLSQTKKGGGRAWGEDFIVDVGPGLGLFPRGGDI